MANNHPDSKKTDSIGGYIYIVNHNGLYTMHNVIGPSCY